MKPMSIETQRELVNHLAQMTLLFRMSLLNTSPEIAKDGMKFVREANDALAKARAEMGGDGNG